jgi:hypothetical protein
MATVPCSFSQALIPATAALAATFAGRRVPHFTAHVPAPCKGLPARTQERIASEVLNGQ